MKFLQASNEKLVFQLGKREKRLLLQVLDRYPCLPPAHQPLSKSAVLPDHEASQHLLDEALSEQRAENKKQIQALLADRQRLTQNPLGWLLTLTPAEVEWLLQVLNDIRVGSWVLLGSPEQGMADLTEETAPHILAMESAGFFQSQLLEALGGGHHI